MNREDVNRILTEHKLRMQVLGRDQPWSRPNFRGSNLRNADLHNVTLFDADMREVDLLSANLRGANLFNADLRGADLRRADLRGADLDGANLHNANMCNANLGGANIDYSTWPLWCGSVGVRVDARIAYQLAAHVCAVECDDPEVQEMQRTLAKWAIKSHRATECKVGRWMGE